MEVISTACVNKPFHFPVVSSFLHGKMDQGLNQGIDLANICGLIRLSSS